jgi:hypothetical protein
MSYLCRVTLEFLYNYAATDAAHDHMTPLGLRNCIDSIELLSSGRRIQEFSREVILAKMSDNPSTRILRTLARRTRRASG